MVEAVSRSKVWLGDVVVAEFNRVGGFYGVGAGVGVSLRAVVLHRYADAVPLLAAIIPRVPRRRLVVGDDTGAEGSQRRGIVIERAGKEVLRRHARVEGGVT